MENIKTLADACAALGTTVEAQFPEEAKKHLTDDELAYRELKIIAKALNQSDGNAWEPDWSNWNEAKYYPWLEINTSDGNKAGSSFSDSGYDCDYSNAAVGSRLSYKTRELARYAARQFADQYKRFWLIKK